MNTSFSKLSIKGLLLVSALLFLELLFVGCHAWLLAKAEAESSKQERAKEIIAQANNLMQSLYEAGDNVAKYTLSHDLACQAKYETAREDVPTRIAWLKEHLVGNPTQLNLLDKIEVNVNSGLSMLADMKHASDTEAQLVAMQHALKLRTKMQAQMQGLVQDLGDFLNIEKKIESASPAAIKYQRDRIRWLLLSGLAVNIIAAVMLAQFFVRSITSRLAIVVDNSDRLRQRRILRAPLAGDDEIALLDKAFHEMSRSLRGEEALVIASEQQVRTIINEMPIGLMILAAEEIIEYANPMLEKLLDYTDGALVGTRLSSHFSTAGLNAVSDTDTTSGVVNLVACKRDRSELHVEFSVVDVSLGKLSRRLAIVIDVNEKHEMEKMRQAFVAMVSHELRTPLTSVAGFLQLLPMGVYGQISSPAIEQTSQAEAHVDQLIMLINDLLDLEKLQAGKLKMVRSRIVLEDVIDETVDSVCSLAESLGISVLFEGCQIDVIGDGNRLQQALSKMLTCLLRLCPAGETVSIVVEGAGKAVTTRLITNSLDIPDDQLQSIFEPFQQLDLPTTKGSLGLGLPLAQAIAVQHGGTCGATKAGNSGTSLWLQIPR